MTSDGYTSNITLHVELLENFNKFKYCDAILTENGTIKTAMLIRLYSISIIGYSHINYNCRNCCINGDIENI